WGEDNLEDAPRAEDYEHPRLVNRPSARITGVTERLFGLVHVRGNRVGNQPRRRRQAGQHPLEGIPQIRVRSLAPDPVDPTENVGVAKIALSVAPRLDVIGERFVGPTLIAVVFFDGALAQLPGPELRPIPRHRHYALDGNLHVAGVGQIVPP